MVPVDFVVVHKTRSTGVAAGETDTTATIRKPIREGRIKRITASVIDPAYSSQSTAANALALLDRVGVKVKIDSVPLQGSASDEYIPLSDLTGARMYEALEWDIPVEKDSTIEIEYKNLDTSNSPALTARVTFHIRSDRPRERS